MRRLAFSAAGIVLTGSLVAAVAAAPTLESAKSAQSAAASSAQSAPSAQSSEQSTAAVSGYICPMHPDVVEGAPGKCPRCGMDLVPGNPLGTANYRLRVEAVPNVIKAGAKTKFKFHIEDPVTRQPVKDFAIVHDMPYHLFVLSRDTKVFMHVHPEREPDGTFSIEVTLPQPGHYVLISDFFPVGGSGQVLTTPIVTAGFDGDVFAAVPTLALDDSWTRREDGVTVDMRIAPTGLVASEDLDLPMHFTNTTTGEPVRDLERYLGAFAHALIVNEDLSEYIHAHPEEMLEGTDIKSGGGPDVVFHTLFPKGGRYKAWIQFQRGGKLSTVSFTFKVLRPGENITGR